MLKRGFVATWMLLVLTRFSLSVPVDDNVDKIIEVVIGESVSLPCPLTGHPKEAVHIWKKDDKMLLTVGLLKIIRSPRISLIDDGVNPFEQLRISPVTSSDAGTYSCQVGPDYDQPNSYSVKLIVKKYPVRVIDGSSDVFTGSNFTLECTVEKSSSDLPNNYWYHNNAKISDSDRLIKELVYDDATKELHSRLTVLNASRVDGGPYVCRFPDGKDWSINITIKGHSMYFSGSPPPSHAVHVTGVTFSSVDLRWSYDDEEVNKDFHYIVSYRPDHSDEDFTHTMDISTNSYRIDGLMPMTEYAFQVTAIKKNGVPQGLPSPTILVTTATISFSLLRAVENGHLGVVKDLLALDPDIDEGDGMYLKMASQMGHLEVVKFLLQEGADPDADEDGEAVQEAAKNGHVEVVQTLLEAGADANVGDGMHWAVANSNPEIVKILYKYGSDVNKPLPEKPWKDPDTGASYGFGWTALHVAARWGKTSMVDLLYHLGSNFASTDPNGDTPLHVAVKYPQIWFVRELLNYCPDLTLENNDGKTVIDLVEDLPHAIYKSLSSDEGIRLRHLVANITLDKLKIRSSTEEAAVALEDEIEALVESNMTISDLVDAVASTDSHVDYILQELFEDTVYLEIEDAFADHLCTYEDKGEWRAEFDVKYEAMCVCVTGKGPTLQLKPLSQSDGCGDPIDP